ncbi:uncharacterized protein [Engystomops pustulosus]|uniref:uncharacterized protein isoform X2 n=2 Tax=Engystomops pustulosus TaxID=76066 RepID=UPI003AFA481E
MDEILKSEIFLVVYEKKEVSLEEFGGLFRQVHGYYLNLSNYGYSSLKTLLHDMNDLVELRTIDGINMIRCKSRSSHHVVVANGNNFQAQQISGISSIPSSVLTSGPVIKKPGETQPIQNHMKVRTSKSTTANKSKDASKSKCSLLAQKTDHAVGFVHCHQPKKDGFSKSLKTPTINPVCAGQASVATASSAAKKSRAYQRRQESNATSSNPKSERNITSLQNVKAAQTRAGPNRSYAFVCASNVSKNQIFQNQNQLNPNHIKFSADVIVNTANVTLSHPKEPRTSIQPSSVIKENIQTLLNHHANGISVFQLQKLYLFMFNQTLKSKGSITVKHLLLELKDVVKTEGVGVQMQVYPVSATSGKGNHDAKLKGTGSLFTSNFQKEVCSSDFLNTQNDQLQKAGHLLHDDQMLSSEQNPVSPMDQHIAKVMQMEHKPLTPQNVEKMPSNGHYVASQGEEPFGSIPDTRVLPAHINAKLHPNSSVQDEILEGTSRKNGPSQNVLQDSEFHVKPGLILHSTGFTFVMRQQANGPQYQVSEVDFADTTNNVTDHKMARLNIDMLKSPKHSQERTSNSIVSLQDTKPHQLSVLHADNTNLQMHNSIDTMETCKQIKFGAVQPSNSFQTANNCNTTEYPTSSSRDDIQSETVLVQREKLPLLQNSWSGQNSQQYKASVSLPANDLVNTNDLIVHGAEQAVPMSSDVKIVVNTCTSKEQNNKSTIQIKQFDEVTNADRIQASGSAQETTGSPQNIATLPKVTTTKHEFKNNLEKISKQDEINSWQTNQEHICCII